MYEFAVDMRRWGDGSAAAINQISWRAEVLLTRNKDYIAGKRILDLACNKGQMSYACLELGAEYVVGVEARKSLINVGLAEFSKLPYAERMSFVEADAIDYLASIKNGAFDTILCLGFLYHTTRQADFFRECKRISPETIIVESSIAKNYWWFGRRNFGKPPALFLYSEDPTIDRNTTDTDGIMYFPTRTYLERMFLNIGYYPSELSYRRAGIKDWTGLAHCKKHRAA